MTSEEEAELMARIKREDIEWDARMDIDCVFCWAGIGADEDFGVAITPNGTYYLCEQCNVDGRKRNGS